MRAFTATGIEYDVAQAELLDIDMSDDYDVFVNGNHTNVDLTNLSATIPADSIMGEFEKKFAHDEIDNSGSPVFVYLRDGKYVAWWDDDRYVGYIA